MNKSKKIIIAISEIVVVALACVISYSYGFRNGIFAAGLTNSVSELIPASDHMADQMENANCEA